MNNKIIPIVVLFIAVSTIVGWNHFFVSASNRAKGLAVIQDSSGNRLGVEPVNNEVWNTLVELYHSGEAMWIGGRVEKFLTFRPDPNYAWGFRFNPESIVVAEITAEGLQSTVRDISENLDYWLGMEYSYVLATVTEIHYSLGKMKLTFQLSANPVVRGDIVTISAALIDETDNPIEGATVTATIGDLEILFLLSEHRNGDYNGKIDTSIVDEGSYEVVISAEKEGYESDQSSQILIVNARVS